MIVSHILGIQVDIIYIPGRKGDNKGGGMLFYQGDNLEWVKSISQIFPFTPEIGEDIIHLITRLPYYPGM
jgi:hypothetical protein